MSFEVQHSAGDEAMQQASAWDAYLEPQGWRAFHCTSPWVGAIAQAFRHTPHVICARRDGAICGVLPLLDVKSLLFGRFLVSIPYVNWGGVFADDDEIKTALIDRAIGLADELNVRYLELRHEDEFDHPGLTHALTSKVHMRLKLPETEEACWSKLKQVVRTQIRKAEKKELEVSWGREELLSEFYDVFAVNMRDLGTPVFSKSLFASIMEQLGDGAELCVVRMNGIAIASSLAIYHDGLMQIPSASALRKYRDTAANSLMYWRAIQRAYEKQQRIFDFGRSTVGEGTYIFKKKWGAVGEPAVWQYHVRKGDVSDMRPDNSKFGLAIRVWQKIPVPISRVIGPPIVRGIP